MSHTPSVSGATNRHRGIGLRRASRYRPSRAMLAMWSRWPVSSHPLRSLLIFGIGVDQAAAARRHANSTSQPSASHHRPARDPSRRAAVHPQRRRHGADPRGADPLSGAGRRLPSGGSRAERPLGAAPSPGRGRAAVALRPPSSCIGWCHACRSSTKAFPSVDLRFAGPATCAAGRARSTSPCA